MKHPVDFYFDFSSPYGYLAGRRLGHLASTHERHVNWRPIIMSAGDPSLGDPRSRDYAKHDLARVARYHDIPFAMPDRFPLDPHLATLAYYALAHVNADQAVEFAKAVQESAFGKSVDIADRDELASVAHAVGADPVILRKAWDDAAWQTKAKIETQRATDVGVVGAPFFIVNGEPFLGYHMLIELDGWLTSGGW